MARCEVAGTLGGVGVAPQDSDGIQESPENIRSQELIYVQEFESVANRQTFSGDRSVGAISIPLQFGAVIDSAIDYK
jgi:hypothetical protein